jgi:hypothetical protein
MNKKQLYAIAYNYTKQKHNRQYEFLKATGRINDYNNSKYKTTTTYILYNNLTKEYYDYCIKNNLKPY